MELVPNEQLVLGTCDEEGKKGESTHEEEEVQAF